MWGYIFRTLAAATVAAAIIFSIRMASAETGKASIMSNSYRTASGERYDPDSLIASHKSLPFGTRVIVYNAGKSVSVVIKERGGLKDRVIGLTPKAAAILGIYRNKPKPTIRLAVVNTKIEFQRAPAQASVVARSQIVDEISILSASVEESLKLFSVNGNRENLGVSHSSSATLFQVGKRQKRTKKAWPRVLPETEQKIRLEAFSVDDMQKMFKKADNDEYLCDVYKRSPIKKDRSGDFTWKDIIAAKRVNKTLCDYVIGGLSTSFKDAVASAGRQMDKEGIRWTILSAFRDDYRQRLASGFKARTGNSLHGGSRATCGYGCGRAIDIGDADGGITVASGWIARNGHKWGLRRPMPVIDPAHIQFGYGRVYAGKKKWRTRYAKRHRYARHHKYRHRRYASQ